MGYGILAARVLVGVVFAASAIGKLRGVTALRDFEEAVRGMGLPAFLVRPVAFTVVAAECAIPLLVAAPLGAAAGLSLAAVMLMGFTVVIAGLLRRDAPASCHCFGGSSLPVGARHLVRNGFLLLVAMTGAVEEFAGARPARDLSGCAVTAFGAVVGALLVIRLDDLAELMGGPAVPARSR